MSDTGRGAGADAHGGTGAGKLSKPCSIENQSHANVAQPDMYLAPMVQRPAYEPSLTQPMMFFRLHTPKPKDDGKAGFVIGLLLIAILTAFAGPR